MDFFADNRSNFSSTQLSEINLSPASKKVNSFCHPLTVGLQSHALWRVLSF